MGNLQEANRFINEADKAVTPSMHFARGYIAYALARTGQDDKAMDIIKQLEAEQEKRYISPAALFWAYLGVRDLDRALLWLNRVIDENVYIVTVGLLTSPLFDELRKDLRSVSTLDRLGLYEE